MWSPLSLWWRGWVIFHWTGTEGDLGLTLSQRNKGRTRAASPSPLRGQSHHRCVWEQPFLKSWPTAVRVCAWLCRHVYALQWERVEWSVCEFVCPYTVVWLLGVTLALGLCLYLISSRSRRCEEKAGCSSPQTLAGALRFHSPCRLCAGSAGLGVETS